MDLAAIDLGEFGKQLFLRLLEQTSTEGEFEDLYERCKKNDVRFVDENFPASAHSLINNWEDDDVLDKVITWKRFVWRRVEDFLTEAVRIFQDRIEPADIRQGCLGDCYFLSVLSVLAENPHRIRKLFITETVNDYGIYAVNICKNGMWRHVIVDDFFPCSNKRLGPCFSKANGEELWVLIMEKAWAKLHGSYERIEAGLADNVFRDLTGAPTQYFSHDDDDLWANMLEANSQGFLMAASAGTTEASQALLESVGLIGQHSYGLLDVRDIDTKDGPEHLVKLRNPWGDFEWKGDWSDSSSNWTPELKAELDFTEVNDGTFWMSFADFCHYFSRVQICRINDDYKYVSYKAEHDKGEFALIRMSIPQDSLQYISVSQVDQRTFPRNSSYEYSAARLIVSKLDEETGELEYLFGKMKVDRDLWEMYHFTAGEYLVYVEIDWQSDDTYPFVVSSYGETEAYFIRDQRYEHKDFLQRTYISCGKKNGKRIDFSSQGAPNCFKYTDMCQEGYGYVYFENMTEDATLKESVTYTRFENLELVKPFKGTNYQVNVPPGENLIVLLRQSSPYGYNLSFSYSSTIVFSSAALKKQVKERGNKIARRDPRLNVVGPLVSLQDLQIYVYTLKHGAGICYFYENLTSNRRLEETVRFKTTGLEIVGHKGSDVRVSIGPGESQFLELKALTPNWSIQTSVSYGIM